MFNQKIQNFENAQNRRFLYKLYACFLILLVAIEADLYVNLGLLLNLLKIKFILLFLSLIILNHLVLFLID